MPFGLKGAAQTFQRLMDSVLRGKSSLFVYLDDILVASASVHVLNKHEFAIAATSSLRQTVGTKVSREMEAGLPCFGLRIGNGSPNFQKKYMKVNQTIQANRSFCLCTAQTQSKQLSVTSRVK